MDVLLAAMEEKKRRKEKKNPKTTWTRRCTLQEEEGVNIPIVPQLGVEAAAEPEIHK